MNNPEKINPLKKKAEEGKTVVEKTEKALKDSINPKLVTLDELAALDQKRQIIKKITEANKKNN
ncbi:MAG: hypothetical protein AAB636_01060 [Patescibacteria group bacterium]